jgi:hypothetical protein
METRRFGCVTATLNILTGCEGEVYELLKVETSFCIVYEVEGKFIMMRSALLLTLRQVPSSYPYWSSETTRSAVYNWVYALAEDGQE